MADDDIIVFDKVDFSYGERQALRDVDLKVPRGVLFALILLLGSI